MKLLHVQGINIVMKQPINLLLIQLINSLNISETIL